MFECLICVEEYKINKKNKVVDCPSCNFKVCSKCQFRYAKSECMSCHIQFTNNYIASILGKTFIDKVVKPNIVNELLIKENERLKDIEPLIKWKKECEFIKSQSRYGLRQIFPKKPVIGDNIVNINFPCPMNDCRGYVNTNEKCISCNTTVCIKCKEIKNENHECDKNILESLNDIMNNSKPCPKCKTPIHKTMGCNHMFCTYCGTHFNWSTLTITSINGYHHLERINTRNNIINNDCVLSLDDDRIPRDIIDEWELPFNLKWYLYEIPKTIRQIKKTTYNEEKISQNTVNRYDDLLINYFEGKINETQWKNQLFINYKTNQLNIMYSNIYTIYLQHIDDLQSETYNKLLNNETDFRDICESCIELIKLCNESFYSIHNDYGNNTISKKLYFIPLKKEKEEEKEEEIVEYEKKEINRQVILHDYQITHANKLIEILKNSYFAIDLSPLGTGKTYVSTFIYLENDKYTNILTISPTSVNVKWIELKKDYEIPNMTNLTYKSLIGTKNNSPNCGLIIRNDYDDKVIYSVSPVFKNLAKSGLLLIIDEFQNIKNDSLQKDVCHEMIKYIKEKTKTSRVLLLSGSPMDKNSQVVQFFKTINVMKSERLASFDIGYFRQTQQMRMIWEGMDEIVNFCIKCPIKKELYIEENHHLNVIRLNKKCFELFLDEIKPNYSSSMLIIPSKYKINKYNGFYNCSKEQKILLDKGLNLLNNYLNPNIENGNQRNQRNQMNILTKGLLIVETSKIPLFVRLIKDEFDKNPNKKIVVSCNFSETIIDLEKQLSDYSPLVLNGSKTTKERTIILKKFQDNTTDFRLLIGNIKVINSGIDLDDKFGNMPRTCFVSPSYGTIDLYQLSHRFLRSLDTKSDTNLFVCYLNSNNDRSISEKKLLDAINKKGNIMKKITLEQHEQGVIFPCDFETFTENYIYND